MLKIQGSGPILLVDDDQDALELARMVYADSGIPNQLVLLSSGKALMNYFEKVEEKKAELPAMVLLDVNMPELNGHEALHLLRGQKQFAENPPIVIFTSSCDEADKKRALANGANGFQIKSLDFGDTVKFLQSLV